MPPTHGLIIKKQWLTKILAGTKTWELRGRNTTIRGKIALIQAGSGKIFGTCELVDALWPLSMGDLKANVDKHQVLREDLMNVTKRYKNVYAWVLRNAERLKEPVSYEHPKGAVVWVRILPN
jgi:hypothetical protein